MVDEDVRLKEAILQMSYEEIVRYMNETSISAPMSIHTALTQRLYELALYDHHVSAEHRKNALELLDTVKAVVEESHKERPDMIKLYRSANQEMEEGVRRVGIGSLGWLIEENGISSDDELVRFIARPEHGPLLDDYFSTLGSELVTELKSQIAKITKVIL